MKKIIKQKDGFGTVQKDFMKMDISVYAKCVYTLLRTYSGQSDSCYPSMKTICDDLKISKSTLIRAVKELEKIEMVAVRRSKKKGSNENSVNTYIPLSIMVEIDIDKVDSEHDNHELGGTPQTPRGITQTPGVVSEEYWKNNSYKNNIEDNIQPSASDLFSQEESEKQNSINTGPAAEIFSFDEFWNMYGKKEDRSKTEKKFKSLSNSEKSKIKELLPNYIRRRPDKKYRKNPLTWLNGKCWLDEEENKIPVSLENNSNNSLADSFYSFQTELYNQNTK